MKLQDEISLRIHDVSCLRQQLTTQLREIEKKVEEEARVHTEIQTYLKKSHDTLSQQVRGLRPSNDGCCLTGCG